VQIEVVPADAIDEETREKIRAIAWAVPWDPPGEPVRLMRYRWASDPSWRVIAREDGQVVSHASIHEREVLVNGEPVRIGGIGAVMTAPEHQGRGLATAVLRRAHQLMCEELQVPFALLICLEHRQSLYEGLGWQVMEVVLEAEQPDSKVVMDDVLVMGLSCGELHLPSGVIDLCGSPW
jgi:predicted acetyltransferase